MLRIVLLATPLLLAAEPVPAPTAAATVATPGPTPTPSLQPIEIHSERSVYEGSGAERRAILSGNVVARQGDLTIRATQVEAILAGPDNRIERVVAHGGIGVTSGGRHARADRVEFDNARRTLVLSGDPKLWDRDTRVVGERIVLHVDEGTLECFRCRLDLDPAQLPSP